MQTASPSAPISARTARRAAPCCAPGRLGSAEIAVEGAPAPGGGRYAGFGPWPTVAAGGVTAFVAALDGGPAEIAAFAGTPDGGIKRVVMVGEALPQGGRIGPFAANAIAAAGPGGMLTVATMEPSEAGGGSAIATAAARRAPAERRHRHRGEVSDEPRRDRYQLISNGGYSRNTLRAVISMWCVVVCAGMVSPLSSRSANGSTS